MSIISDYENLVINMNKKEQELHSKVKYYKENMEQLIRIKLLEQELESLDAKVQCEIGIRAEKNRQDNIQKERIQYCKDNCKTAFDMLNYQNQHNNMMANFQKQKLSIKIPVVVKGFIGQGQFNFTYSFKKLDNNNYETICTINSDTNNLIEGIYNVESGFNTLSE
jgi:hypothetical protein